MKMQIPRLTGIVKFTAIVWCREERHQLSFGKELVAVLDNLMRTANQVKFMFPQEFRYDLQWIERQICNLLNQYPGRFSLTYRDCEGQIRVPCHPSQWNSTRSEIPRDPCLIMEWINLLTQFAKRTSRHHHFSAVCLERLSSVPKERARLVTCQPELEVHEKYTPQKETKTKTNQSLVAIHVQSPILQTTTSDVSIISHFQLT